MAFEWTDLIEPGLGALGSVVGNKINAGATKEATRESGRQFDVNTARADQARQMLYPVLAKNLGVRAPSPNAYGTMPYGAPSQSGGGGLGKLGTIGAIAGASSMLPGAAGLLGMVPGGQFIAPAILGAQALRKIGAGRRAADRLTGSGGAQGQFGALMKAIAEKGLSTDQTRDLLARGLDSRIQAGLGQMRNNKDRLVMRQWLQDFAKPEWVRDHPQLAAVAQRYLGSVA